MEPTIRLADLVVHHPTNVLTDAVLAVQCAVYGRALLREDRVETRTWAAFLVLMSISTAMGALKHGIGGAAPATIRVPVVVTSAMAAAVATLFAQLATLELHWVPPARRRMLFALACGQLTLFSLAFVRSDAFALVGVNTAIGLLPVLCAEAWAAWQGRAGAPEIAAGLVVALVSGAAYAASISPSPWFNRVDVAHLFMFVALAWISRGVARLPRAEHPAQEVAAWT